MAREELNSGAETAPDSPPEQAGAAPRPSLSQRLRSANKGNLMLAGLFVAGIATVYLMSLRHGPAKASAEQNSTEAQVNTALSMLSKASVASVDRPKAMEVVSSFYYAAKQRQIPLNKLAGNPFVFRAVRPPAPTTRPVEAVKPLTPNEEDMARDKALSEALSAARSLRLQSVLIGSSRRPTAIISNNLLTEDQMVQGWTLAKIMPREVLLTWKDQKYVLKMQE
jgi:hypothetical protein